MGWKDCPNPKCGKEFWIEEMRFPFRDSGGSLSCTNCGTKLHSWDKGTYDYRLVEAEVIREQQKRREWEAANYPKCDCGNTMVKRKSGYGEFFGCANYPYGCTKTVNVNEDEYEDEEFY